MSLNKVNEEMINDLYDLILSLKDNQDCRDLFSDMCTNKEVEQMAQRIRAARLLLEGKTYNEVIDETDISSATLSRVSRCVQYGSGYKRLVEYKKKKAKQSRYDCALVAFFLPLAEKTAQTGKTCLRRVLIYAYIRLL